MNRRRNNDYYQSLLEIGVEVRMSTEEGNQVVEEFEEVVGKSRDRSSAHFFKRFSEMQSFMRFIEERSFVSAPETFVNQENGEEMQFVYEEFPTKMNSSYIQLDRLEKSGKDKEKRHQDSRAEISGLKKYVRLDTGRGSDRRVLLVDNCDDTAVAVVSSDRKVLSSERYTERAIQRQQGGINPSVCAQQHRQNLPRLIEKSLKDAKTAPEELDAVAVTVTPGLVIALKEGIAAAISFARKYQLPLIPVHHMRAHALSILLVDDSVQFPFSTLLLSGGHALIAVAEDAENFKLYGQSISGSPGECIDKVARQIGYLGSDFDSVHAGVAVEELASRASGDGHKQYPVFFPNVEKANMNFDQIKGSYLNLLDRIRAKGEKINIPNFCASLQNTVARHIASKLHVFFDSMDSQGRLPKQLVIGGGVAANKYIYDAVSKLSLSYGVSTVKTPLSLCTDNAEMIAYTGILMHSNRSEAIYWKPQEIPDTIYAHARTPIGPDSSSEMLNVPTRHLVNSTIHGTEPIRFRNFDSFKKLDK